MVTKSSVVAMQPGGVPARAKVKPAAAGLALINETLDADVVRAMVDADRFRIQVQQNNVYLGEGELSERGRFIERARPLQALLRANNVPFALAEGDRVLTSPEQSGGVMIEFLPQN